MQILQQAGHGMKQKTEFNICTATLNDAHAISEIEKKCFSSPWSENLIAEEILKDNVVFLTAKSQEILCGYVSGQLILDEFYISNIAVTADFRNCGIASSLLDSLIRILKNKNCVMITLEVRQSNAFAIKLYENFGFKNLGIRKNFYSSPTENAYIYTLYLTNNGD